MWPMFLSLVRPDRISSPITMQRRRDDAVAGLRCLAHASLLMSCARALLGPALGDDLPVEGEHALRDRLAGVSLLVVRPAPFDQVGR